MWAAAREHMFTSAVKLAVKLTPHPDMVGAPLEEGARLFNEAHAPTVVLVPGFAMAPEQWNVWEKSLARDGFTTVRYVPPNPVMDSVKGAKSLALFIHDTAATSAGGKVNVLTYSKGALDARAAIEMTHDLGITDAATGAKIVNARQYVNHVVTVDGPNDGLHWGIFGKIFRRFVPEGGQNLLKGSDAMNVMDTAGKPLDPTMYTTISPKQFDGVVWPPRSGQIDGARNLTVDAKWFGPFSKITHLNVLLNQGKPYEMARDALAASAEAVQGAATNYAMRPVGDAIERDLAAVPAGAAVASTAEVAS